MAVEGLLEERGTAEASGRIWRPIVVVVCMDAGSIPNACVPITTRGWGMGWHSPQRHDDSEFNCA